MPPRIALDVMGGDLGPSEVIAGAVEAARNDGASVTLVGRSREIDPVLGKLNAASLDVRVVEAADVIGMDESPVQAVKSKPESSIVVGTALLRSGEADGFVSMGNTGAVMTAALLGLGRVRGVERPALATPYPTFRGHCLLLDVGANADCRPEQLLQFAQMGAVYWEKVFDVPRPRVGLLSNGEEETKGNALVKEAHGLIRASGLNFVGNVEGKDIPNHPADVIVMDGFTGNVVLKLAEGISTFLPGLIREEAKRTPFGILGGLLLKPTLRRISRRIDYEEYGGATLLGVQGVCIKAHGRSNARAIRNAVRVARHAAELQLVNLIRASIQSSSVAAGAEAAP